MDVHGTSLKRAFPKDHASQTLRVGQSYLTTLMRNSASRAAFVCLMELKRTSLQPLGGRAHAQAHAIKSCLRMPAQVKCNIASLGSFHAPSLLPCIAFLRRPPAQLLDVSDA